MVRSICFAILAIPTAFGFYALCDDKGSSFTKTQREAVEIWLKLIGYHLVPILTGNKELDALSKEKTVLEDRDWVCLGRSIHACQPILEEMIQEFLDRPPESDKREYYILIKCIDALGKVGSSPCPMLLDERLDDFGWEVRQTRTAAIGRILDDKCIEWLARKIREEAIDDSEKGAMIGQLSGLRMLETCKLRNEMRSTQTDILQKCETTLKELPARALSEKLDKYRLESLTIVQELLEKRNDKEEERDQ